MEDFKSALGGAADPAGAGANIVEGRCEHGTCNSRDNMLAEASGAVAARVGEGRMRCLSDELHCPRAATTQGPKGDRVS
jgi:hypothetical protein